jgi:hypothetical protein
MPDDTEQPTKSSADIALAACRLWLAAAEANAPPEDTRWKTAAVLMHESLETKKKERKKRRD